MQSEPLFLDTETTTDDEHAEVVEVAVVRHEGTVLLDALVRPRSPISPSAKVVHGIGMEKLAGAPSFVEIWPRLTQLLSSQTVVAYNVAFDRRVLRQSAARYGLPELEAHWVCLIEAYTSFTGRSAAISLSAASRRERNHASRSPSSDGRCPSDAGIVSRRWRRVSKAERLRMSILIQLVAGCPSPRSPIRGVPARNLDDALAR